MHKLLLAVVLFTTATAPITCAKADSLDFINMSSEPTFALRILV